MPKKAEKKETTEETVEETVAVKESSKKATETKKETSNPSNTLSDFDWHNYEEGIDQVDEKQIKEFEKLVEENFVENISHFEKEPE